MTAKCWVPKADLNGTKADMGLVTWDVRYVAKGAAGVSPCGLCGFDCTIDLLAAVVGALIAVHHKATVGMGDRGAGDKRQCENQRSESAGHDHLLFFDLNFAATAAHTRSYVERHELLRALHPHLL